MTGPRSVAVEHLRPLPPAALAAFAARCTRLAQAAWRRVAPDPGGAPAEALDAAIRLAEAAGRRPGATAELETARAALAQFTALAEPPAPAEFEPVSVPAGDRVWTECAKAACSALDAAQAQAQGVPGGSPGAVWWAYLHAYHAATDAHSPDLAGGMADALYRLQDAARRGELTPTSAVGPEYFDAAPPPSQPAPTPAEADALSEPPGPAAGGPDPGCRADPTHRPAADTVAFVITGIEETAYPAAVTGLSATGVSLVLGQALTPGQIVQVQLRREVCGAQLDVKARVASARRLPGDAHGVACLFMEPIADGQLRDLL